MVAKRSTIASTGEEVNEVESGSQLAIVLSDEPQPATVVTAAGARREDVESKILAWEAEEVARLTSRSQRQKAVIDEREREQVEKASAGLKKIKRKLEERRADAAEKMDNEVAVAKQKADERRAEAEGSRKEKVGKVMKIANIMKVFGRLPSKQSFFKL